MTSRSAVRTTALDHHADWALFALSSDSQLCSTPHGVHDSSQVRMQTLKPISPDNHCNHYTTMMAGTEAEMEGEQSKREFADDDDFDVKPDSNKVVISNSALKHYSLLRLHIRG